VVELKFYILRGISRGILFWMAVLFLWNTGCVPKVDKKPLTVFIAGSLVVPFAELEEAYEELHPEVDVQVEAHGSIQVIRHVTEIHDEIDIVIPADYTLIPLLMYRSTDPETGLPYVDWTLKWAGNRFVLAYQPESRYADVIDTENWYEIIARPDVRFGFSDPRFDAAGYRALMIGQLAERYYDDPTIFEKIFLGRFKQPILTQKESGQFTIHVPEFLETTETSNIVVRGGSVALLALLESGDIDYTFEYKSVARQHGLAYVELPPELNLGDPAYAAEYETVRVVLDFQRFSSVKPSFQGETITYGLAIPTNAPHPEEAESFLVFLLGSDGREILDANHHPMWSSIQVDDRAALPVQLQSFLP
jgi:molybdate/tungstate transport system substrate-binding protein